MKKLKFFPVTFFSVNLGLLGTAIAVQKIEEILGLSNIISTFALYSFMFIISVIFSIYTYKMTYHFDEVRIEYHNPIRVNFFPITAITFLLLNIAFVGLNKNLSKSFFIIGAITQLIFILKILSIWIHRGKISFKHYNPAWFIPIVGALLVPVTSKAHGLIEVGWFFYSIGLIFWITLFVLFIYRIIFHDGLHAKLLPTFFMLMAPPATAFIGYAKMVGGLDNFGRILYYFALFTTMMLFSQTNLIHKTKFYISWWAYSFPMASVTMSTVLMYHMSRFVFFKNLAFLFFVVLVLFIIVLVIKTTQAIFRHEICIPEE